MKHVQLYMYTPTRVQIYIDISTRLFVWIKNGCPLKSLPDVYRCVTGNIDWLRAGVIRVA